MPQCCCNHFAASSTPSGYRLVLALHEVSLHDRRRHGATETLHVSPTKLFEVHQLIHHRAHIAALANSCAGTAKHALSSQDMSLCRENWRAVHIWPPMIQPCMRAFFSSVLTALSARGLENRVRIVPILVWCLCSGHSLLSLSACSPLLRFAFADRIGKASVGLTGKRQCWS